jgi:hypothetical protein
MENLKEFLIVHGESFKEHWNKSYKWGHVARIKQKFGLTNSQIYTLKKILNLPSILETPGRKEIAHKFTKAARKGINLKNLGVRYGCSVSFIQKLKKYKREKQNNSAVTKSILKNPTEFKQIWHTHKSFKGGYQKLMKHYGITWGAVSYIKKKLHLHDLGKNKTRRKLEQRIIKLYQDGLSSERVARKVGFCAEQVRIILQEHNIKIRPPHVTDPRFFKTQSGIAPGKLLSEIKRMYVNEQMPCKQIADRLGIWEGTVSSKLKAMGIQIGFRRRQENIQCHTSYDIINIYNGGDPFFIVYGKHVQFEMPVTKTGVKGNCVWCGTEFLKYISKGIREQIFCSHRCKNRAKDLRRILKPRWVKKKYVTDFSARLKVLSLEIKGDIEKLGLTDDVKEKVYALRAEVSSPLNKSHDKNQRRENNGRTRNCAKVKD